MKNKKIIEVLSEKYDSFYLYDETVIAEKVNHLKRCFKDVEFLYSMKCNHNKNVLKTVFSQGFNADAASLGEVNAAKSMGLAQKQIYYSAPGKTEDDIAAALENSIIIADSIDELYRLDKIAQKQNKIVEVGIRINPNFTFEEDVCRFNKFGIDEEQAVDFLKGNHCKNTKVTGIHVHLRSQELSAEKMKRYYEKMFELAEKFVMLIGSLDYINLGSGMGIAYAPQDKDIDVDFLGEVVEKQMKYFKKKYPNTKIMIETGRYVSCKAGVYATKVVDRKVSCGKTFLILKNTLNGFIRPAMEQMIVRNCGDEFAPLEPLFTKKDAFRFLSLKEEEASEVVSLFGNLCTANDLVASDIMMPHLECGDVIVMTNAGSYGAVLSPMQFSSQEKPVELFLTKEGEVI